MRSFTLSGLPDIGQRTPLCGLSSLVSLESGVSDGTQKEGRGALDVDAEEEEDEEDDDEEEDALDASSLEMLFSFFSNSFLCASSSFLA